MVYVCIILFVVINALWFFTNEYPSLYGVYVPACVLRRTVFKTIVAVSIFVSVILAGVFSIGGIANGMAYDGNMSSTGLLIVSFVSLIVLTALKQMSINGSSVYAVMGASAAMAMSDGTLSGKSWCVIVGVFAAPVMSMVLSYIISRLFKATLGRSHAHLLILSHYMRIVTICGIVLVSVALGLNWGGFLMSGIGAVSGSSMHILVVSCILALALMTLAPFMREESDENAGMYSDFSIYDVLSVGFAVAVTLLFFSFSCTASLAGLVPTPLSVGSLVLAAIAGTSIAQKSPLLEAEEYTKGVVSLLVAPVGSFLLTYLVLSISRGRATGFLTDFGVIVMAMMVLMPLVFIGYIRNHRLQSKAVDRLVYSQQQQIYENSRALNDMELKVVLSENQALHNAVEMKKQEVMNVALSIVEQKEYLESLDAIVKKLAKSKDEQERNRLIAELSGSLKQRLSYDRDVDSQYFYAQAECLHEDFNAKLSENFPDLTQQERRLATLLRLGFSSKYIATLMNITPKSVEISRYRLRQKLGLSKGDNLVNFIKSI